MRFLLTRAYDWLNRREDALVSRTIPPTICAGCASIRARGRSATTGARRAMTVRKPGVTVYSDGACSTNPAPAAGARS